MVGRSDTPAPPVYGWKYERGEPLKRVELPPLTENGALLLRKAAEQVLEESRKLRLEFDAFKAGLVQELRLLRMAIGNVPVVLRSQPLQPRFRDIRPPYEVTS